MLPWEVVACAPRLDRRLSSSSPSLHALLSPLRQSSTSTTSIYKIPGRSPPLSQIPYASTSIMKEQLERIEWLQEKMEEQQQQDADTTTAVAVVAAPLLSLLQEMNRKEMLGPGTPKLEVELNEGDAQDISKADTTYFGSVQNG